MNYFRGYYFLLLIIQLTVGQKEKSSLTFVIDDTGSMSNDIEQVKHGVKLVFDTVLSSNRSQIDNFILVTFNDPGTQLRTVTKNEDEFKRALESIYVNGGGDCPELSMAGIELALTQSLPGSNLYVLTDASAKDLDLLDKVKNLASKKFAQVVFLLTGRCGSDDDPGYQAYHKLSDATNGQVFHMTKDNVGKILAYVAETVSSRKTVVTKTTFPPGYDHDLTIPVDADMKDVVIAGSGTEPKIDITAPDGSKPHTEKLVDIPEVISVKIKDTTPGNYTAKVGSKSETSVVITATTTIQFKHGFSLAEPSSIEGTAIQPLPDKESHLSIKLITDDDGAVLNTVVLSDLEEHDIVEMPLMLIDEKQKFYTTNLFVPPNTTFKITVKGYDTKSKAPFKRTSPTPIEPQNPILVRPEDRAPTVKIEGGLIINAEYNQPLKISCKINGFPKPDAVWSHSDGSVLTSDYTILEVPYDFINILAIDTVRSNDSYTCKAVNMHGEASQTVEVKTIKKDVFEVIESPKDTTIKYRNTGQVTCKINAEPPAEIKWLHKGKEIIPDGYIDISPDGSVLTIKDMRKHLSGTFACKAKSGIHDEEFIFNINISGFDRPKIEKVAFETSSGIGEDAEIRCRILEGEPAPQITWFHLSLYTQYFDKLNDTGEVIKLPNVNEENAGFYRCIATNDAGRDHHLIELTVEYPPTVSVDKTYVRAREGAKTTLKCHAKGAPEPRVEWFLNGVKIISDRNHHIYRDNSLKFTGSKDNVGRFTCAAKNHLGSNNKSITVDYLVPVSIYSPEESTFEVRQGDNLQLPCRASGYPQPKLTWLFFNSVDKEPEPKKMMPTDSSGQIIDLRNIRSTNDGYYTCIARNVESSANFTYQVKVMVPPRIERAATNTFTGVVDDLIMRLPCKASGYPKPEVTWSRGGLNVASGSEWYDIEEDGTLVIKNLDRKSAGTYVCTAQNSLGSAIQALYVNIKDYPDEKTPSKTISLEEGESDEIECDIPHTIIDTVRWFKDRRPIGLGETRKLEDIKVTDAGIYTCRVSNFNGADSESIRVVVGYKPVFESEVETVINFSEGMPAVLNCEARGEPEPQVTWLFDGEDIENNNSLEIVLSMDRYNLVMTFDKRGEYTCVVSNHFGSINRTFEVFSKDCLLSIQDDLLNKQPLMIDEDTMKLAEFENNNGVLRIPSKKRLSLYCPSGFEIIPEKKISVICERETNFLVNGHLYEYTDLNCQEEIQPKIRNTGRRCNSGNSEVIKIGYEFPDDFQEVYEVCIDKDYNVPVYAKQRIQRSLADKELKGPMWESDSFPLEFDELYWCDTQINAVSSLLRRWFHETDRCCFDRRQLVNSRDLSGGLPQKAALTYLNVVPHWSTCNTKNWDELERRVRDLAKSSYDNMMVWTGTSGQLTLNNALKDPENIILRDTRTGQIPVPKYLWKVIQNQDARTSLAVIQLNIPDLTVSKAYSHMPCKDICPDIEWMSGNVWRDPAKGYTVCCSLPDFETTFGFKGLFGTGNHKVLKESAMWGEYSY
ncbi:hemicentin-1-like isoform X2 [Ostrinia furnacalis]|uniref:hemicentin-1-like isoform X2 n=1 Tax=Ostrinia furnacalis TaxID=93504 RepID=UPI00103F65F4|nr:hemicentin-1-like isoform X2 [Ostrinia furnacalis]